MFGLPILRGLIRGTREYEATPPDIRERYAELYTAELQSTAHGRTFHRGKLFKRRGLNVLHLAGDRFEMAFQHGRLLREEIADGSLDRAASIATDAIRHSVGDGPLGKVVTFYAMNGIGAVMLRSGLAFARSSAPGNDRDHLAEAYGLSEGSGVPVETILRAVLGPETAQTLLGKTAGIAVGVQPASCTSFAAWGGATKDGGLIIGRNTDYPLTGYYDRHPTVIYYSPSDGAQKFMAVTSAGFHNAGVCGMNQAGIYLAIHTVPASRVSESNLPVFMIGQHVLRTATNFAEAEAILVKAFPAAGWSYHVVSTKERRTATFELSADKIERVDAKGDYHVTTNHWRSKEMSSRHLFVNGTVEEDSRARMNRVAALIEAAKLDAESAAAILGDKRDPVTNRERILPNTVAATTTVSSSVWLPGEGRVFVANGRAPVSQSEYVELPALERFDATTFADEPYRVIDNAAFARNKPNSARAQTSFVLASQALELEDDAEAALAHLEAAVLADPSEPSLHVCLGLVAVRVGRYERAQRAFETAKADGSDPRRRALATFFLARTLAHAGRQHEALAALELVANDAGADAKLKGAAAEVQASLAKRSRVPLKEHEISPMLFAADAFRYRGVFSRSKLGHDATRDDVPAY